MLSEMAAEGVRNSAIAIGVTVFMTYYLETYRTTSALVSSVYACIHAVISTNIVLVYLLFIVYHDSIVIFGKWS